ncbi:MAG: HAMP domain-containing sensor histidine kinase [bacterium]
MLNLNNISQKIRSFYNSIKNTLFLDSTICEDLKRKKFILNILCLVMITFFFLLLFLSLYSQYRKSSLYTGVSIITLALFIIITSVAFWLSKKNFILVSSSIILALIYSCIFYGSSQWGADLPTVLIALFITVLISGILINSKAGLISAILLSAHLWVFNYIESNQLLEIDYSWKDSFFNEIDVIEYSLLLIFAAFFSWLSNSQLEKALNRSRKAEAKLQFEKDNLELKVKERTEEIKALQIDKINSMYRMVEFGRISSGLFHDIMSPLTGIALNLQMHNMEEAKETVNFLIPSIKKMETLMEQSRKHIKLDSVYTTFSITEEMRSVVAILKSKGMKNNVKIILSKGNFDLKIYGSQTLFSHIIMNLVSNGIDSHVLYNNETTPIRVNENKKVVILIKLQSDNIYIRVIDNGQGIKKDILDKIFEPFYTTKQEHGCGIGLSATKHILEKYFKGKISVKSKLQKGSIFTVVIPV